MFLPRFWHHDALIEGTIEAVRRYGTQYSSSRAFSRVALYDELEDALGQIFRCARCGDAHHHVEHILGGLEGFLETWFCSITLPSSSSTL